MNKCLKKTRPITPLRLIRCSHPRKHRKFLDVRFPRCEAWYKHERCDWCGAYRFVGDKYWTRPLGW